VPEAPASRPATSGGHIPTSPLRMAGEIGQSKKGLCRGLPSVLVKRLCRTVLYQNMTLYSPWAYATW
jgi:hypothetical protein